MKDQLIYSTKLDLDVVMVQHDKTTVLKITTIPTTVFKIDESSDEKLI